MPGLYELPRRLSARLFGIRLGRSLAAQTRGRASGAFAPSHAGSRCGRVARGLIRALVPRWRDEERISSAVELLTSTDGPAIRGSQALIDALAAEAVLERFRDKEDREGFYGYFRELEEVYEILSPDPFLRPFLEDYQTLAEMCRLLRSAYEPHIPVSFEVLCNEIKGLGLNIRLEKELPEESEANE